MGKGRWAVVDCSKVPSENMCQMKMMAPEDQMDDLIEVACQHACTKHGHTDSPELRQGIRQSVEFKEG
jgi:hypothetical protein